MNDNGTTTAAPATSARLVQAADGHARRGTAEASGTIRSFPLDDDLTTIGGDEARDITLHGLDAHHGDIVRLPDSGEHVYRQCCVDGISQVNGAIATVADLHHGSRLTLGDWTLIYQHGDYLGDVPTTGLDGSDTSAGLAEVAGGIDAMPDEVEAATAGDEHDEPSTESPQVELSRIAAGVAAVVTAATGWAAATVYHHHRRGATDRKVS